MSAATRGWPFVRWKMCSAMQPRNQITQGVPLGWRSERQYLHLQRNHHLPQDAEVFTDKEADNRIINAALYLQKHELKRQVVLVTKDINMRLKAQGGRACSR